MSEDIDTGARAENEEQGKAWRPSRKPEHLLQPHRNTVSTRIVERPDDGGLGKILLRLLKLPLTKAIIAVCLFVTAAILFDATLNGGGWTEKEPPAKPAATRRARPAAQ